MLGLPADELLGKRIVDTLADLSSVPPQGNSPRREDPSLSPDGEHPLFSLLDALTSCRDFNSTVLATVPGPRGPSVELFNVAAQYGTLPCSSIDEPANSSVDGQYVAADDVGFWSLMLTPLSRPRCHSPLRHSDDTVRVQSSNPHNRKLSWYGASSDRAVPSIGGQSSRCDISERSLDGLMIPLPLLRSGSVDDECSVSTASNRSYRTLVSSSLRADHVIANWLHGPVKRINLPEGGMYVEALMQVCP